MSARRGLEGKPWCVYLLECCNGSYYAGITNDLEARYFAHQQGQGARYTRANPPVRLLGAAQFPDRSSASRAEWEIKRLPRAKKVAYLDKAKVVEKRRISGFEQ